jgi:virulence factor Mce-like protein
MRRILLVIGLLGVISAAAVLTAASDDSGSREYRVELDNAFGLSDGGDVKVAGVRAGRIEGFAIHPESYRALVDIRIDQEGFGDLRTDVECEVRMQSLIGEYFIDCKPGTDEERFPEGETIPVEQTGSTIPVDLVNNIMRRPYRERFSIILGELGAGFAARGADLNETIRRASPALRETNRVLRILAEQAETIRDLNVNADVVVGELADRRREVTRFVREARDTAQVSAERSDFIRGQLQRLPTFLRELRPTMRYLGEAADFQRPALANLSAQAPQLETFFDDLTRFVDASRPALRTLAEASRPGRRAMVAARPRIRELRMFARPLPELARNLAITLEHLDDRDFAIERDPRSPGGRGYTGLEAFLQYIFRQSMATNIYDEDSHILKVSIFVDNVCAQYTTADEARDDPEKRACRAWLGPNQPGITTGHPTGGQDGSGGATPSAQSARREPTGGEDGGAGARVSADSSPARSNGSGDGKRKTGSGGVSETLEKAVSGLAQRESQAPMGEPAPDAGGHPDDALLDFLFGS